ncbi:hypothetical protein SHAb15599_00045 [Acinetobacter phage SH-Ab 15599]|nr:hypothetical protein SHAb15599_00045 [Acinetobacter phage SH-Ab 15599]
MKVDTPIYNSMKNDASERISVEDFVPNLTRVKLKNGHIYLIKEVEGISVNWTSGKLYLVRMENESFQDIDIQLPFYVGGSIPAIYEFSETHNIESEITSWRKVNINKLQIGDTVKMYCGQEHTIARIQKDLTQKMGYVYYIVFEDENMVIMSYDKDARTLRSTAAGTVDPFTIIGAVYNNG